MEKIFALFVVNLERKESYSTNVLFVLIGRTRTVVAGKERGRLTHVISVLKAIYESQPDMYSKLKILFYICFYFISILMTNENVVLFFKVVCVCVCVCGRF